MQEDPIHIELTLQEIRAKQFFNLRPVISCDVHIIGGDERILISYGDTEESLPHRAHLLQNLRNAKDNQRILASNYVKIELQKDGFHSEDWEKETSEEEGVQEDEGIDFYDDLDNAGWDSLENRMEV